MERRPRSITIISWFFIIFGSIALLSGLLPPASNLSLEQMKGHWMVHLSRLLSIIAGLFMLRGHNWARWLLVAWIAFHIILSALHSALQLLIHAAIFSVILYFLFRRPASKYFSGA
jgi:uncharacterized membrane protein HdeD (DUF308 family)